MGILCRLGLWLAGEETPSIPTIPITENMEKGKSAFESLKGLDFDEALTKITNSLINFGFKLLIAIFVFYVGKFLINSIYRFVHRMMVNHKVDASLTTFVLSLIKITLYFILIIMVIGILGLQTSSFLALFASAGVAIGMALSGTLQNFAGGVLILLLKPYKVGDYIEAQGYSGTVKSIQIFNTVINTIDNKAIIIPNGGLSTGSINNYSLEQYRRVDWTIGISYGDDFEKAREVITAMLLEDDRVVVKYIEDDKKKRLMAKLDQEEEERESAEAKGEAVPVKKDSWWVRILSRRRKRQAQEDAAIRRQENLNAGITAQIDRSPFVGLDQLADSSINLVVRAWTHSSNYWPLYFTMNERFYRELPEKGFSFPFPQMCVHLPKDDDTATDTSAS